MRIQSLSPEPTQRRLVLASLELACGSQHELTYAVRAHHPSRCLQTYSRCNFCYNATRNHTVYANPKQEDFSGISACQETPQPFDLNLRPRTTVFNAMNGEVERMWTDNHGLGDTGSSGC